MAAQKRWSCGDRVPGGLGMIRNDISGACHDGANETLVDRRDNTSIVQ
jgi:hypothetical protein